MKDEALKLALEALEYFIDTSTSLMDYAMAEDAFTAIKQALAAPVQEPVQVWQAEGYDALMKEMQMVKARNIRQHAEIERLSALVRAQQITIDKLEQALAAPVQESVGVAMADYMALTEKYVALKATTTKRELVEMSDERIKGIFSYHGQFASGKDLPMLRVIEAMLKENTPPQRTWVSLTDDEMQALWDRYAHMEMMRAIEAKLKEKNTP